MTIRTLLLKDLPTDLLNRFEAKDGVLLTGAGVSRSDFEERDGRRVAVGVPSGESLRLHLLKRLTSPPTDQSLESVAGAYEMAFTRSRLNGLIRRVYGGRSIIPPRFYNLVAALPAAVRRFITTNYDPFLEGALSYRNPLVAVRGSGLAEIAAQRTAVLKPHGDAHDPDGCVITTRDYDIWEGETGPLAALLTIWFLNSTIVAVGYGARDGNLRRLLSAVNRGIRVRGETPHTMYIVVPNARPADFASYAGDEYDLVLINANGCQFLERLIADLEVRRRAAEAAALAALVDPPGLSIAEAQAEALRPSVGEGQPPAADVADPRWLRYGEALIALANTQAAAGRPGAAIMTRARAAQALRLGGDLVASAELHEAVYRDALRRCDPNLLERAEGIMLARDRGVGRLREPNISTAYLAGLAEIFKGFPDDPPRVLEELEAALAAGPPADQLAIIGGMLDRVRAEHSVNQRRFDDAAKWFGRAADQETNAREHDELRIRQQLFTGLAIEPLPLDAPIAQLSKLTAHPEAEALRLRALGWLLVLNGDPQAAVRAFQAAASRAIEGLSTVAAASAYRDMEWVLIQHPTSILSALAPGTAAVRLEVAAERSDTRETVHGMADRAERSLAGAKYRDAVMTAYAAQRLAYHDINPAGVFRAAPLIAAAWVAVIEDAGDAFSLFWTAHHVATAWGQADEMRRTKWATTLRDALRAHATPEIIQQIADHLCTGMLGRAERTGALLLLASLSELLSDDQVNTSIVEVLVQGFRAGWARNTSVDMAGAAATLLEHTHERLWTDSARAIQEEVAVLTRNTATRQLAKAYFALAQASAAVEDEDVNRALAVELLEVRKKWPASARWPEHGGALLVALAALTRHVDPDTRRDVERVLVDDAQAGKVDGIAVLARTGLALEPAVAGRYIATLTQRIRSLTHAANPGSIGWGWEGEEPSLTEAAARSAPDDIVTEAVEVTINLLREDQQWSVVRATWVYFLGRVARERTTTLGRAFEVLAQLAEGGYSEPGDLASKINHHPFSSLQLNIGSVHDLRGRALVSLAALLAFLAEEERGRALDLISTAGRSPEPEVRWWSLRAVREGIAAIDSRAERAGSASMPDEAARATRSALLTIVGPLLKDPATKVREAAISALEIGGTDLG